MTTLAVATIALLVVIGAAFLVGCIIRISDLDENEEAQDAYIQDSTSGKFDRFTTFSK